MVWEIYHDIMLQVGHKSPGSNVLTLVPRLLVNLRGWILPSLCACVYGGNCASPWPVTVVLGEKEASFVGWIFMVPLALVWLGAWILDLNARPGQVWELCWWVLVLLLSPDLTACWRPGVASCLLLGTQAIARTQGYSYSAMMPPRSKTISKPLPISGSKWVSQLPCRPGLLLWCRQQLDKYSPAFIRFTY